VIRDNLTQLAQILTKQKFLLGDEFSMLDVAIAPRCGGSTITASRWARMQRQ